MKALRRIVLEEAIIGVIFLTVAWYVYYITAVWGMLDYTEAGTLSKINNKAIIPNRLNTGMSFFARVSLNPLNSMPMPSGMMTSTVMVNAMVLVGTFTSGIFEQ